MRIAIRGMGRAMVGLCSIVLAIAGTQAVQARTEAPIDTQTIYSAQAMQEEVSQRATASEVARCVVRRHRTNVRKALAMPVFDKAVPREFDKLVEGSCIADGAWKLSVPMMRGSLYAALYAADYAANPNAALAKAVDFSADVAGNTTFAARDYLWLHQFADCVVHRDVADSRALVLASVASADESSAFTALKSHLGPCLAAGHQYTFSKGMLATLIAEALYRATQQALPASQAG